MREKLAPHLHEDVWCTARVRLYSSNPSGQAVVLLGDLYVEGSYICDHIWLRVSAELQQDMPVGKWVTFIATVCSYERLNTRDTEYGLRAARCFGQVERTTP